MALPKLNSVTYKVVVPSTGESVELKPFTVKEQKMLLLAKESQDKGQMIRAARDLIESCTMGKVDTRKMTMYDFEYLFIKARAKSVGETSEVGIGCEKCDHTNEVALNLDDVYVTKSAKDLKVKLDDNVGVILKFPSLYDAEKGTENNKDDDLAILLSCIDTIYTQDEVFDAADYSEKELVEFIESFSAKQLNIVSAVLQDMPKTVLDVEFTCQACKHKNTSKVEGLNNFF